MPDPKQEQFRAWLAKPNGDAFTFQENNDHYTLIRVLKNAGFDYLYILGTYKRGGIERSGNFEYAGIYCRRDGMVYDDQYSIRPLRHEELMRGGAPAMLQRLEAGVRQAVEAAIGNDRSSLRITELVTQGSKDRLENHMGYGAASEARDLFLHDEGDGAFTYRCPYNPPRWTEDSLLEYILDPEGYTAREAAAYIDSHQDNILYDFLSNDATAAEYRAIVENPRHPAHLIKRIMQAVGATTAKTVRVTIRKDGLEFTFKTRANEFRRDCGNYYWSHNIAAADRREFERQFGRGDYGPEDILRIEYGRAVVYEAIAIPDGN
jgi:hypothetical protein